MAQILSEFVPPGAHLSHHRYPRDAMHRAADRNGTRACYRDKARRSESPFAETQRDFVGKSVPRVSRRCRKIFTAGPSLHPGECVTTILARSGLHRDQLKFLIVASCFVSLPFRDAENRSLIRKINFVILILLFLHFIYKDL